MAGYQPQKAEQKKLLPVKVWRRHFLALAAAACRCLLGLTAWLAALFVAGAGLPQALARGAFDPVARAGQPIPWGCAVVGRRAWHLVVLVVGTGGAALVGAGQAVLHTGAQEGCG